MQVTHYPALNEQWHDAGFVVSQANGHLSVDQITLAGGVVVLAGTVLGKITSGGSAAATVAAAAGNTGNGTLTIGTQPVANVTPAGVYTVTLTAPTVYSITGPGNFNDVDLPVGTAFDANGMVFTVAAGGTAFVAGDSFTITVTEAGTTGQYVPWNAAASDGSQTAVAILRDTKDTTGGPVDAVVYARQAEVNGSELIWPNSFTNTQKTAAIAALASAGLIVR